MSILRTALDQDALPDALLAIAKQQMRIDGIYDDAFILSLLQRALGKFEQVNGVALNPATFVWIPDQARFCENRTSVPVTPVSAFVAKVGATDVSASYTITTDSVFGVPILYLNGAWQTGLALTLTAGFTQATLPPPVLDAVLRVTAHLHEHREILIPDAEFVAPDFATDSTWWVPRL